MRENFSKLVERAMADPALIGLRPVIEKEVLHYDILFALDRAGFLQDLTFQGGTSLRLCYGSQRFSEDLDFAGGAGFSAKGMASLSESLRDYLDRRYGLQVSVRSPKETADLPENRGVRVEKWQVSVTTSPDRPDLPRQRIKLEIANIPAYTREVLDLDRNYDFLPDGYGDILVGVETLDEIMADKLLAFPVSTQRIRHRDLWDLRWLSQKGARPDTDLISRKVADYGVTGWEEKLGAMVENVEAIAASDAFRNEMGRFVSRDAWARTFARDGFTKHIGRFGRDLFAKVAEDFAPPEDEVEFRF